MEKVKIRRWANWSCDGRSAPLLGMDFISDWTKENVKVGDATQTYATIYTPQELLPKVS